MHIQQTPSHLLVSVDGACGEINNSHLGGPYSLGRAFLQGALEGLSKDGAHGAHAPLAQPGAPGGNLVVDLQPLATDRGISARVLQPASPPIAVGGGQLLRLSSCGGDGAEGGRGEDGADGKRGSDGRNADLYSDATDGKRGGDGGNAGNGSHGGAGGDGGRIEIIVDDADTNLLLAVYTDVRGGRGGPPGENGMPGRGGKGGKGGDGYEWSVHVGWDDNNVPVYERRNRSPGKGGRGGRAGAHSTFVPLPGPDGRPGEVLWVVRYPGTHQHNVYTSRYDFELQSFQISDENEDGIFEPGEHIFVHNIRVKNVGGMPTPSSWDIPVKIRPTLWIEVTGETIRDSERMVYLPRSIQPGETVTVPGSIKAMLRPAAEPSLNQPLVISEKLQLIAIMPGLEMEIPGFQYEVPFQIKYPVEIFLDPNNLRAAPQNSEIKCAWRIVNTSSKPYGLRSASQRRIVVGAVGKQGLALMVTGTAENPGPNVSREIPLLRPGEYTELVEYGRVEDTAEPYTQAAIDIALLLSPPPHQHTGLLGPREIQVNRQSVQIASRFRHHPNSDFLLLANHGTMGDEVATWTSFIDARFNTPVDTWNISLYGGLTPGPQAGLDESMQCILEAYTGKSIVLFGNTFSFFASGQRTILDLCDPHKVNEEVRKGSRFDIFVPPNYNVDASRRWLSAVVFPRAATESKYNTDEPRMVDKLAQITAEIRRQQQYSESSLSSVYEIPVKRFFPGRSKKKALQRVADNALKNLRKNFPQERFCIIPSKERRRILVMQGLSYGTHLCVRPAQSLILDPFAAIAALPLLRRLALQNPTPTTAVISEKPLLSHSHISDIDDRTFSLLTLSITLDLYTEIHRFLSTASWPDSLVPSTFSDAFLRIHFPHLFCFLTFYKPLNLLPIPHHVSHPLQQVIAGTRSQTHGERLTRTIMAGFHRRTRLRSFLLKAITTYLPKSVIELSKLQHDPSEGVECVTTPATTGKRKPLITVLNKRKVGLKPRRTREEVMSEVAQTLAIERRTAEEKISGSVRVENMVCWETEWEEGRRRWAGTRATMEREMGNAREVVRERLVDRAA